MDKETARSLLISSVARRAGREDIAKAAMDDAKRRQAEQAKKGGK